MEIPLKALLLKSFEDNDDVWEDDAFNALLSNEHISSEQWKWHCRFWLSEMAAAGLMEITDTDVYSEEGFAAGKLRCRYKLTDYGRAAIRNTIG